MLGKYCHHGNTWLNKPYQPPNYSVYAILSQPIPLLPDRHIGRDNTHKKGIYIKAKQKLSKSIRSIDATNRIKVNYIK